jgi:hypothetical protein
MTSHCAFYNLIHQGIIQSTQLSSYNKRNALKFATRFNLRGHLSRNTNKMQLVIEFIIPKFIEGSICFERHTAHHQELQTVYAASGLYTHVVPGRCEGSALTMAGHHMGI